MKIENRFLFNFSVSYNGGGIKRLHKYADWFNRNGGAWFVIHPNCEWLIKEFPNNEFFVVKQASWQRVFNDCGYLAEILEKVGPQPDLYYSYGIPIYRQSGKLNWFHLSNVLPLAPRGVPLNFLNRFKLGYLGRRIKRSYDSADIISAESSYSLQLINKEHSSKFFKSVNGSDDELDNAKDFGNVQKDETAIVLGTYKYKALEDSLLVFKMLRSQNRELKLIIIGDDRFISSSLRREPNVIITGMLQRPEVIEYLKKVKYYISTTHIENSYNAASEGVFFADESFISDIGPHRELLEALPYKKRDIPGMTRAVLHVRREEISGANLKSWEDVISEMNSHYEIASTKI
jgi:glycosyltransferase involved in cell wall biosynthesis